jgi:hypothetical protein
MEGTKNGLIFYKNTVFVNHTQQNSNKAMESEKDKQARLKVEKAAAKAAEKAAKKAAGEMTAAEKYAARRSEQLEAKEKAATEAAEAPAKAAAEKAAEKAAQQEKAKWQRKLARLDKDGRLIDAWKAHNQNTGFVVHDAQVAEEIAYANS